MPNIGEKAPDFTLYDSTKNERKLSEFLGKGKKTILAFYPGAFTGVCDKEMCTIRDSLPDLNKVEAQVIGISVDAPFANKAFAEKYSLTFPLLSDFKREVIRKYGVVWDNLGGVSGYQTANRAIFILDDDGNIRYRWVAEKPGIEPNYDELKAHVQKM